MLAAGGFLAIRTAQSPAGPAQEQPAPAAARRRRRRCRWRRWSCSAAAWATSSARARSRATPASTCPSPCRTSTTCSRAWSCSDLDGGHISAVSYDSQAPIEKTLQSFAINLTGNPGFGQILNQARGEKVEVVLQQANAAQPGTLTGTVIGVEKQKQAVGKDDVVEVELLNLWCAEGMRSVKLADVQRVRFLNPVMDSEFKKALETLALSHDTQKKAVSASASTARASGRCASATWSRTRSGRPAIGWCWAQEGGQAASCRAGPWSRTPPTRTGRTSRMALVSRPADLLPDGPVPAAVRPAARRRARTVRLPPAAAPTAAPWTKDRKADDRERRRPAAGGRAPAATTARGGSARARQAAGESAERWAGGTRRRRSRWNLARAAWTCGKGVASAATAAKLGDFFQYAIDQPVSLPRQKSALLPIVSKDVEADRVSIYNERDAGQVPAAGPQFKNTTGLHLMQGPITVFEGSNYAGDARILDLQPNEERLLSYAIDLGTEVNPVAPSRHRPHHHGQGRSRASSTTTTKVRESKTYTVKNRNEHDRVVLIEHPVPTRLQAGQPGQAGRDGPRRLPLRGEGRRRQDRDAGGRPRSATSARSVALTNSDDQTDPLLPQPAGRSARRSRTALQQAIELKSEAVDDAARDPAAGAAAEGDHRRPGAAACQPARRCRRRRRRTSAT